MMYLNEIKETFLDYPDDESLAVIAFFEGCSYNCYECQNKELQTRTSQSSIAEEEVFDLIVSRCDRNKTNKIVLSGGDPFFYKKDDLSSIKDLQSMMSLISSLEMSGYEVCVYTGGNIDYIESLYESFGNIPMDIYVGYGNFIKTNKFYLKPTYLKCGTFKKNLIQPGMGKTNEAFVLASSNQDFYKKENTGNYRRISSDGILRF